MPRKKEKMCYFEKKKNIRALCFWKNRKIIEKYVWFWKKVKKTLRAKYFWKVKSAHDLCSHFPKKRLMVSWPKIRRALVRHVTKNHKIGLVLKKADMVVGIWNKICLKSGCDFEKNLFYRREWQDTYEKSDFGRGEAFRVIVRLYMKIKNQLLGGIFIITVVRVHICLFLR